MRLIRPFKVYTDSSYASVFCTIFIVNSLILIAIGVSFIKAYDLGLYNGSCLLISAQSVFNLDVQVTGDWINQFSFIQYPLTVYSVCPSLGNDVQITYNDSDVFMQTFTPGYPSLNTSYEIKDCSFSSMYKVMIPVLDEETDSSFYEIKNVVEKGNHYTAGYVNVSHSFINNMDVLNSKNETIATMRNDFESFSFIFTILDDTSELTLDINFLATFVGKYLMGFQSNSCNKLYSVLIWLSIILTSLIVVFIVVGVVVICSGKSESLLGQERPYNRMY